MIKIVKTTEYFVCDKINENSQYHYIRSEILNSNVKPVWFVGYISKSSGFPSSIGPELNEELQIKLENDFQKNLKEIQI